MNFLLPLAAFLPLILAPLAYVLGNKQGKNAIWTMVAVSAVAVPLAG